MLNSKLIVQILRNADSQQPVTVGDYVLCWDETINGTDLFAFGQLEAINREQPLLGIYPFQARHKVWENEIRNWTHVAKVPDDYLSDCLEWCNDQNDK